MAIMSSSAISRSVLPLLISRRTSTSRWESPPDTRRQTSLRLEISSHPPVGAGVASPSLSKFGGLLPAAPAPGGGPRYPCAPTKRQHNSSRSRHIRLCGQSWHKTPRNPQDVQQPWTRRQSQGATFPTDGQWWISPIRFVSLTARRNFSGRLPCRVEPSRQNRALRLSLTQNRNCNGKKRAMSV